MKVRTFHFLSAIAVWGALVLPAGAAPKDDAQFITFDAPGADLTANDYNGTFPSSINDLGVVAGSVIDTTFVYRGFVRSPNGKIITFQAPGADTTPGSYNGTVPNSINDLGEITGYYFDGAGLVHGFLRSPSGKFTSFDVPGGGGYSFPIAMNLEGAVVGYYLDPNFLFHAFLRRPDGSFKTWVGPNSCDTNGSLGCYGSAATNINIFGLIAGGFEDNSANQVGHSLVRSPGGKLTPFSVPEAGTGAGQGTGCPGCSLGLNDSGAVAGIYIDANFVAHGFLRSPEGALTEFDAPDAGTGSYQGTGCPSDCQVGLNDAGTIAGTYVDANNVFHGFVRSAKGVISEFDAPGAGAGSYQGTTCQFCSLGLNQSGLITGSYSDANNVYHGFIRTPPRDP
jgi:hypothetical protein